MDRVRHALAGLLAMACMVSTARADKAERIEIPDADPEDAKAVREVGLVLQDGKGHYIAFTEANPAEPRDDAHGMFYGDGKTLYRVDANRSVMGKGLVDWVIVDVRRGLDTWRSKLTLQDGAFTITCRSKDQIKALTPVSSTNARALLAKAEFKERRMDRKAYALGRDGTTYYYVDIAVRPEGNTDFRLYVGKRGAAKRFKLKHSATDSEGTVLVAKEGTLRVMRDPFTLQWSPKPAKKIALTVLELRDNPDLMYYELGVYTGKPFGLPCDDM